MKEDKDLSIKCESSVWGFLFVFQSTLGYSVFSNLLAGAFSATARIFYLCRLVLAYAELKKITSSSNDKTV